MKRSTRIGFTACCTVCCLVFIAAVIWLFVLAMALVDYYSSSESVYVRWDDSDEAKKEELLLQCTSPVAQAETRSLSAIAGFAFTLSIVIWLVWGSLVVLCIVGLNNKALLLKVRGWLSKLDYETPPLPEITAVPNSLIEAPRTVGGLLTIILVMIILVVVPYTLVTEYFLSFSTVQADSLVTNAPPAFTAKASVIFKDQQLRPVGIPCDQLALSLWDTDSVRLGDSFRIDKVNCTSLAGAAALSANALAAGDTGAVSFEVTAEKPAGTFRAALAVPSSVMYFDVGTSVYVAPAATDGSEGHGELHDVLKLTDAYRLQSFSQQTVCLRHVRATSAATGIGTVPRSYKENWVYVQQSSRLVAVCASQGLSTRRSASYSSYNLEGVRFENRNVAWNEVTDTAAYTNLGSGNRTVHWIVLEFELPDVSHDDTKPVTRCTQDQSSIFTAIVQCLALVGSVLGLRLAVRGVVTKIADNFNEKKRAAKERKAGAGSGGGGADDDVDDAVVMSGASSSWKSAKVQVE